jgi:hypothetical protein
MAAQPDEHHSDPVVAAIERVLKIERDGVETLRRSEEDARQSLTQARAQAVAVASRADSCIARLHTAYMQKVGRDIQTLAAAHAADRIGTHKIYDVEVLAAAARRVAAKLTGGS